MKKLNYALLITLASLSLAACGEKPAPSTSTKPTTTDTNKPVSTPKDSTPSTPVADNAKVTLTGKTTIGGTEYEVTCKLYEDGSVKIAVPKASKNYTGTYTFTEGKGYTITVNEVEYKSTYNAETKEHEVDFALKLGDAGSGTVKLTVKDEAFTPVATGGKNGFIEDAKFTGSFSFMGDYTIGTTFTSDGKVVIAPIGEVNNTVKAMLTKEGTYTYANNVFTLTFTNQDSDPSVYKSVYDPALNTYTIPYYIKGREGNVDVDLVYVPEWKMVGSAADFGGLTFDLFVYSDKTAKFDITTTMPTMNDMFDRDATWEIVDKQYVFTVGTGENAQTFTTKQDEKSNWSLHYEITGDRKIEVDLTGNPVNATYSTTMQFGVVDFELRFSPNGNAFLDVTCQSAHSMDNAFDKTCTYSVDNSGNIVLTESGVNTTSTFDETLGQYVIAYSLVGQQATIPTQLALKVWKD